MQYPPPGYQSGRNTPQSMFQRPTTNYLDVPIPGSPGELDLPPGAPTDSDLERSVQDVLRNADLNSITKREIRRRLEAHYGMDMTSRKATINAAVDRVLLAHA
jgi:chitin synthase